MWTLTLIKKKKKTRRRNNVTNSNKQYAREGTTIVSLAPGGRPYFDGRSSKSHPGDSCLRSDFPSFPESPSIKDIYMVTVVRLYGH